MVTACFILALWFQLYFGHIDQFRNMLSVEMPHTSQIMSNIFLYSHLLFDWMVKNGLLYYNISCNLLHRLIEKQRNISDPNKVCQNCVTETMQQKVPHTIFDREEAVLQLNRFIISQFCLKGRESERLIQNFIIIF